MLPKERDDLPLSVDGKTVRSTEKKKSYASPLHIVSAQLSELGITVASKSVGGEINEIPAVQELLKELDIAGCLAVADALNYQKETAKVVIEGKADYLLSVKANQPALMQEIADYVQDDSLRNIMETKSHTEKNRARVEKRTAFITYDIDWLNGKEKWEGIACIGAIQTKFETSSGKTSEWHYYISSRQLTADELLHHARMEWAVEAMHWLLDVHFGEDYFRVVNQTVQENMNMLRKFVLSLVKQYKAKTSSKKAMSKLLFDCLLQPQTILRILSQN